MFKYNSYAVFTLRQNRRRAPSFYILTLIQPFLSNSLFYDNFEELMDTELELVADQNFVFDEYLKSAI